MNETYMLRLCIGIALSLICLTGCSQAAGPERPGAQGTNGHITSYSECVKAGYAILRTYPAKCVTANGAVFVDEASTGSACKNRCGDGICQQIVCAALGCPCAETPQNCPGDCT